VAILSPWAHIKDNPALQAKRLSALPTQSFFVQEVPSKTRLNCSYALLTAAAGQRATIVTIIEALPIKYREAIERALLSRNTRVTDFAAVTTALLGCNTAIYLISSGIAATMSTFYLLEYITQNPAMRENSLPLALAAHECAMKVSVCPIVSAQTTNCDAPSSLLYQFPSKAADKGTPVRDALLWLEKAMNSGISQGEMPAMKASSLLLNTQQEPSSHTSNVLNVKSAFLFAKRHSAALHEAQFRTRSRRRPCLHTQR